MTVQPNIVREYMIGNTRIKVADNYCSGKTEADIERILREVARKAQRSISAAAFAVAKGTEVKKQ